MSSFAYIEPALIAPPILPRIFDDNGGDGPLTGSGSRDVMLDAECTVSKLFYEVMSYNLESRDHLGKDDEMSARLAHYRKLLDWQPPPRAPPGRGLHGLCQSLFLEYVVHTVHIRADILPLMQPADATSPSRRSPYSAR